MDVPQESENSERINDAAAVELRPRLRLLLVRWTRDVELAEDLCQDVVLAVVQAIREGRVRSLQALPAYAHQAARNALMMSIRKRSPELTDTVPDVSPVWGDSPPTPLEACERAEVSSLTKIALDSLTTQRDRDLMRGFYADGRSKPELMEEFSLTKDQFDRVISRARSRMLELLRQKYPRHEKRMSSAGARPALVSPAEGDRS